MLRFLFDTDHLTLYDFGQPQVRRLHAAAPLHSAGLTVVTIEEQLRGRLAALSRHTGGPRQIQAYAHLLAALELFKDFPPLPFDQAAEARMQQLRALRLRVGTQDLKIASIALANGLVLLTRNRRDFAKVPGLMLDDWSV